ncbi:MAG: DsrE family protein [Sediminibacterium sp.]|jgi:intracellular sulfur oxidation DsrE/DsrF family protein
MKKILLILILIAFTGLQSIAQTEKTDKVHKVIIQLNTADTAAWSSVIGNIKNFQKVWPGHVKIEVVVHGKALNFLVASKTHLSNDIETVSKQGVVFNACENTMNKYGIKKDMLLQIAGTVPSGVAELVIQQENGWSYLKAGL